MKRSVGTAVTALTLCAVGPFATAFVAVPPAGSPSSRHMFAASGAASGSSSALCMSQDTSGIDRSQFLAGAAAAVAASATGLGLGISPAVAAGAGAIASTGTGGDVVDLESGAPMPMATLKVTAAGEDGALSEDAARIQRKLAAQAKITGKGSSGQQTYQESRAAESEKQAKMKADRRDMAKRRAALCEELGRGC